jgi:hypothetical protein
MKVFITVWNRYSWLIKLCEDFVKAGLEPVLIDNKSTYEPCVEWLSKCPYKVIRMNKNYGPWAFFTSDLWKEHTDRYVMFSDSDYDISQVPSDFPELLMKGLQTYNVGGVWKVGLSVEISDLPKNNYTDEVIKAEQGFWNFEIMPGFYRADIDIGIAVYDRSRRSGCGLGDNWYAGLRTTRPYTCKHLDWYLTPENLRDEDLYFFKQRGKAHHGWTWVYNKTFKSDYND